MQKICLATCGIYTPCVITLASFRIRFPLLLSSVFNFHCNLDCVRKRQFVTFDFKKSLQDSFITDLTNKTCLKNFIWERGSQPGVHQPHRTHIPIWGGTLKVSNERENIYSRIGLIRHLKVIRKKWRIMQTGDNFIIVTHIHSAFICSKIQFYDVMIEYNN